MANEVTIPILPCRQLDDSIPFYEALGFKGTYRQNRPNPYAVVVREDIQIHLFAMDDFDPEQSYGSVIVAVPDPDELYEDFAAGPRAVYGKLPSAGIPRILRPRKKQGTVRSFSVVDPDGNWLRISRLGYTEDEAEDQKTTGLA
jgi:catechol 2,3-dioxygenase-like lactoylglutathione lyase family enzyme